MIRSYFCQSLKVSRLRNVFCGVGALVVLCNGTASGQETPPDRRFHAVRHSIGGSPASWSSSSEASGLAELDFVETLRRHGRVQQYKETPAAGLRLYHYSAGLKFELPVMDRSRWDLVADFGLGATRLRSAKYGDYVASGERVSQTFLSLLGGVSVQYSVSDELRFFVGARQLFYLEDGKRPLVGDLQNADHLLESGSWAFPLTLGLRFQFR